jgi:putative ABC transport system substrate-binding protein
MNRRTFLALALAMTAVPPGAAAQGTAKVARIGWLTAQREASLAPFLVAVREGFVALGYTEGRNLRMHYRYGDDNLGRVPELAAELVRLPVDVIMAQGAAVSVLAKLNLQVPVVYVTSGDPVSAGLAHSLARPRGNMTGLTFMAADFNGKRLELLREIIPSVRRVALVANPAHPGEHLERDFTKEYGRRLALRMDYFATRTSADLSDAFTVMAKDPPQAILLFADGFAIQNRQTIIDFALSHRVPVISGWPVFARSGALLTFGPHLPSSYQRMAYYVDRILQGTKASDLPIEQPTRFELIVNRRTARTLGLDVPRSILLRADEVID